MIDTDKYEGHPPAPWGWRHKVAEWRLTADGDKEWIDGIRVNEDTDPTVMTLIADAPLLLEEVKRLREGIVDMIDSMDNYYIRDIQHATDCLKNMIGYYEDEEE